MRDTHVMHISLFCYEMTTIFSGDELYHPEKTFVKNVDISTQYRRRKPRVKSIYGNRMTLMKSIPKLLSNAFTI